MWFCRSFALVGAFVAGFGPAAAQLAPPAIDLLATFNIGASGRLTEFGTLAFDQLGSGTVAASVFGVPVPRVSADADITAVDTAADFGRAVASLAYQVQIVGPQGLVPVTVHAQGGASGTAGQGASFAVQASWSLFFDVANPLAGDAIVSGPIVSGSFSQGFDNTSTVTMITNLPYAVTLLADAGAGGNQTGAPVKAHAVIDPVFSIPDLDPALYSIRLSAGIGNTAAVPEPATLPALAAGLLLLAVLGRARRLVRSRRVVHAAAGRLQPGAWRRVIWRAWTDRSPDGPGLHGSTLALAGPSDWPAFNGAGFRGLGSPPPLLSPTTSAASHTACPRASA